MASKIRVKNAQIRNRVIEMQLKDIALSNQGDQRSTLKHKDQ
jgi:hypothetical protein